MSRLLVVSFLCLVVALGLPTFLIIHYNVDVIEEAKWQERVVAVDALKAKSDEIGARSKALGKRWNDAEEIDPQDVKEQQAYARSQAIATQILLNDLHQVLLRGVLSGSEMDFMWVANLASTLILCLAAFWVGLVFALTSRRVLTLWGTRSVTRTLLRDVGVSVSMIPTRDLGKCLDILGVCRWHLLEVVALLRSRHFSKNTRGVTALVATSAAKLADLLDGYFVRSFPPSGVEMRRLKQLQVDFDRRQSKRRQQLDKEVEERVAEQVAALREEVEREQAAERESLRISRSQLWERRQELDGDLLELKTARMDLEKDQKSLESERLRVEDERARATRDRNAADRALESIEQSKEELAGLCARVDAGVQFIQEKLRELDPEQTSHQGGAIIDALAAQLQLAQVSKEA